MIRWISSIAMVTLTLSGNSQQVTDIDGNTYGTVTIGAQVWLNANLRVTHFSNGDLIPTTSGCGDAVVSEFEPKYQWAYNCDQTLVTTYGLLYTWYVAADKRNVCPNEFHVPSLQEFQQLENFLGGQDVAGGKLKEVGFEHWLSPNTNATNEFGYNGLPNGNRNLGGYYNGLHQVSDTWTSTEATIGARDFDLHYNDSKTISNDDNKEFAFAIRCVKNVDLPNNLMGISVYPNPATHQLSIDNGSNNNVSYQFFSIDGSLVLSGSLDIGINIISLNEITAGIYLIKFSDENNFAVLKFSKLD